MRKELTVEEKLEALKHGEQMKELQRIDKTISRRIEHGPPVSKNQLIRQVMKKFPKRNPATIRNFIAMSLFTVVADGKMTRDKKTQVYTRI